MVSFVYTPVGLARSACVIAEAYLVRVNGSPSAVIDLIVAENYIVLASAETDEAAYDEASESLEGFSFTAVDTGVLFFIDECNGNILNTATRVVYKPLRGETVADLNEPEIAASLWVDVFYDLFECRDYEV